MATPVPGLSPARQSCGGIRCPCAPACWRCRGASDSRPRGGCSRAHSAARPAASVPRPSLPLERRSCLENTCLERTSVHTARPTGHSRTRAAHQRSVSGRRISATRCDHSQPSALCPGHRARLFRSRRRSLAGRGADDDELPPGMETGFIPRRRVFFQHRRRSRRRSLQAARANKPAFSAQKSTRLSCAIPWLRRARVALRSFGRPQGIPRSHGGRAARRRNRRARPQ